MWAIASSSAVGSFGFGILNSLLVLYLIQDLHFHTAAAYTLFAAFNGFLYVLPIYSGRIADWFGAKQAYFVGVVIQIIALCLIAMPGKYILLFGLALFTTGAAVNAPAYYVILGKQYRKNDIRRESAFTLAYMMMNFVYLISYVAGAYAEKDINFHVAFLLAAGVTVLSGLIFLVFQKRMTPDITRDMQPRLKWSHPKLLVGVIIATLIPLPFGLLFMQAANIGNWVMLGVGVVVVVIIATMALKQTDKTARNKLFAFGLLSIVSIGFWSLYMLEPSLLTVYIKNNVDRLILGHVIPPSVFTSLDPFFVIVLGFILSRLWIYLRARKRDLSLPAKFTSAILIMGFGFLIFIPAIALTGGAKMSFWWIVLIYFFLTLGEMLISPIGNAMVGRLSPEGSEGLLMGIWQVFVGLSASISAYLAKLAIVPQHGLPAVTNPLYSDAFMKIGLFSLALGLIALCKLGYVRKIIKGND
jgi:POT family proton-dependent oligopeptide transporter